MYNDSRPEFGLQKACTTRIESNSLERKAAFYDRGQAVSSCHGGLKTAEAFTVTDPPRRSKLAGMKFTEDYKATNLGLGSLRADRNNKATLLLTRWCSNKTYVKDLFILAHGKVSKSI